MPAKTLTQAPAVKHSPAAGAIQVVLYARVSSKDQEKEGFSIPAQLRLLRDYAETKGFAIAHEFTDVETAKEIGRTNFGQMLAYLKKHPGTCRTILVEKTDRLYRNIKDYATVDELDVAVHLVKENEIISRDSRSSEQFVHGIKVLMARNYSLNLGEETVKGMTEKARAGFYPSCAPVGYRNVDDVDGKRIIVPDPEAASVVAEVFERFATGRHSVKALVRELNSEGYKLRGRNLYSSVIHQILRKRLYTGDFDWDGKTYAGTHEPLVTRERWQRVQELLDARAENRVRKVKHDFPYTGLINCGHCNCLLVGELKKGKYVYYHCTGNRGKCAEPYTREEVLTRDFAAVLQELVIPQSILEWLSDAVLTSDQTEQAARAQAIKKLQTQFDQINARIETMYLDKLKGCISQEFFDKQSAAWKREQDGLQLKIQNIRKVETAPIDQAINMVRLTSRASELFLRQPATEQRRFLQVVVEKAAWQHGALRTSLFEPFEILRHSNQESCRKEKEHGGSGRELGIWLLR
jgi:site-specific DNA recombinase